MAEYGMKPMLNFTNLPAPTETRKKRRRRTVKTPTNPRVKAVALSQACRSQGEAGGATSTSELSLKWVSPQFEKVPHTQSTMPRSAVPVGRKQLKIVPLEVRGGVRLHTSRGKARKRGGKVRPRRMPLHELQENSLEDFESPKTYRDTGMSKPSKKHVSGKSSILNCQQAKHSEQPCSAVRNSPTASTQKDGTCGVGFIECSHQDSDQLSSSATVHPHCQSPLQRLDTSKDISRMLSDMSLEEFPNPSHHPTSPNTLTGSPQGRFNTLESRGLGLTTLDITAFNPHSASTPAVLRQLRPKHGCLLDAAQELALSPGFPAFSAAGKPGDEAAQESHDRLCVQPWDLDAATSFKTPVQYNDGWKTGTELVVIPNTHRMRFRPSDTCRNHCPLPSDTPSPSPTPSDCAPCFPSTQTTPGLSSPSTFDCRQLFVTKENSVLAAETPRHLWGVHLNKWGYRPGLHAPSVEDTFG